MVYSFSPQFLGDCNLFKGFIYLKERMCVYMEREREMNTHPLCSLSKHQQQLELGKAESSSQEIHPAPLYGSKYGHSSLVGSSFAAFQVHKQAAESEAEVVLNPKHSEIRCGCPKQQQLPLCATLPMPVHCNL